MGSWILDLGMEIRTINPEIALEGGGKEFYQEIRKSGMEGSGQAGRD